MIGYVITYETKHRQEGIRDKWMTCEEGESLLEIWDDICQCFKDDIYYGNPVIVNVIPIETKKDFDNWHELCRKYHH